jgi:hypothetical protein
MVPLASLAALICVGIGVDFSGQTIAEQDLRDQLTTCAKIGAEAAQVADRPLEVARTVANQCLSERGLTGSIEVNPAKITVTSSGDYTTKLLSILGLSHLPVHGVGSASLLGRG